MIINGLEIEREHLITLQYFQRRKEEEIQTQILREQESVVRMLISSMPKSPKHEMKLLNGDKI